MANNRYFMRCDCGSTHYLGKSLGDGIYTKGEPCEIFDSLHNWMWEHLTECAHPKAERDSLGSEWVAGEIFTVITQYDHRAPKGRIPPYIAPPPTSSVDG